MIDFSVDDKSGFFRKRLWLATALAVGCVLGYYSRVPVRQTESISSPSGRYYLVLNYDDSGPRATIVSLRIYERISDRESNLSMPDQMVFSVDTGASACMKYKAYWEDDHVFVFESSDIGTMRYSSSDGKTWAADREHEPIQGSKRNFDDPLTPR